MGHWAWMGITWGNIENGQMGLKHSSQNVTFFKGSSCSGIETCVGRHHRNLTCFSRWQVLRFLFQGHVSWCVIFDQPKQVPCHRQNMTCFRGGFAPRPPLPMRGNPCQAASWQVTHLQFVAEIMLRLCIHIHGFGGLTILSFLN